MLDKLILVFATMCTKEPYLLVEDKVSIIFSCSLYCRYMPTMGTYPQKASFRLLIWILKSLKNYEISKCDKLAKLHLKLKNDFLVS
jgi:hypothetical protein